MNYEQFIHNVDGIKKNIFLIDMKKELNPNFSILVNQGIEKYIRQNKKVGILVNKKGYSSSIVCNNCGHVPNCTKCSVAISIHKMDSGEKIGICHICKKQYSDFQKCYSCDSGNVKEYGTGTQKIAEFIKKEFNVDSLIIDSDSVSSGPKVKKTLEIINNYQVIIGTSLLSTPIKSVKFDLIIFLNADLGLNVPDYTSNENNFWFLYDIFSKHKTSNFLVQTFNPSHYSIESACLLDKDKFYTIENEFRKINQYPPFGELCMIMYKHEVEKRLFTQVDKLYKEILFLQQKYGLEKDLEVYSTPPLIYKIFGKYRYNIILKGKNVRNFMDILYTKLEISKRGFKIDRDVISIV